MSIGSDWRDVFQNWPASIPKNGLIVTASAENVTFVNFLLSEGVILVERDKPDTYGARKVMVPLETITCVKITDPGDLDIFKPLGFKETGQKVAAKAVVAAPVAAKPVAPVVKPVAAGAVPAQGARPALAGAVG